MLYSRAGLVALIFALIISLVSAVPIPATESKLSSTLSSPSNPILNGLNGRDLIQIDNAETSGVLISGRMSTLPLATRLTRRQISDDIDDQLVRRNIFSNIKDAFQSFGQKVKSGFQKAGSAIKSGFEKAGSAIKSGVQKVASAVKTGFQKAGSTIKSGFEKAGSAIKSGVQKVASEVKTGFQKAGSTIKSGFEKAGSAIKSGVQKVASEVKTGFQKAGSAIKTGFEKVGNGVKTVANKAWGWVKTNGATVAKFGLKVVESVGDVVGKVANFIPAVGPEIDRAISGVSKVAGVISDHIKAKLPDNLQKGMDVMNKADEIMSYIPREFSDEEDFQQRDIGETHNFEGRDDIVLENRDESYFETKERDIHERYDLD